MQGIQSLPALSLPTNFSNGLSAAGQWSRGGENTIPSYGAPHPSPPLVPRGTPRTAWPLCPRRPAPRRPRSIPRGRALARSGVAAGAGPGGAWRGGAGLVGPSAHFSLPLAWLQPLRRPCLPFHPLVRRRPPNSSSASLPRFSAPSFAQLRAAPRSFTSLGGHSKKCWSCR